jgi:hypothetical protein
MAGLLFIETGRPPRWLWPWGGRQPGRPIIDGEIRRLIRRMSLDYFMVFFISR